MEVEIVCLDKDEITLEGKLTPYKGGKYLLYLPKKWADKNKGKKVRIKVIVIDSKSSK